jgi:hypothetical protein
VLLAPDRRNDRDQGVQRKGWVFRSGRFGCLYRFCFAPVRMPMLAATFARFFALGPPQLHPTLEDEGRMLLAYRIDNPIRIRGSRLRVRPSWFLHRSLRKSQMCSRITRRINHCILVYSKALLRAPRSAHFVTAPLDELASSSTLPLVGVVCGEEEDGGAKLHLLYTP